MNILKNLFLLNKKSENKDSNNEFVDQYMEIAQLVLKKNTLLKLATREKEIFKKEKKDFLFSKFDLINTWQGTLLYFLVLVLTIFILKRYFLLNVNIIEIENIENKIIDK